MIKPILLATATSQGYMTVRQSADGLILRLDSIAITEEDHEQLAPFYDGGPYFNEDFTEVHSERTALLAQVIYDPKDGVFFIESIYPEETVRYRVVPTQWPVDRPPSAHEKLMDMEELLDCFFMAATQSLAVRYAKRIAPFVVGDKSGDYEDYYNTLATLSELWITQIKDYGLDHPFPSIY